MSRDKLVRDLSCLVRILKLEERDKLKQHLSVLRDVSESQNTFAILNFGSFSLFTSQFSILNSHSSPSSDKNLK